MQENLQHPPRGRRHRRSAHLALACALLGATGCSGATDGADGDLIVATTFFPLDELARRLTAAVDGVRTTVIVPPGEQAHDYEPAPAQLRALADADLVLYLGGGLQPALETAIDALPAAVRRVNLLTVVDLLPVGHDELGRSTADAPDDDHDDAATDPHVWLSPRRMGAIAAAASAAIDDLLATRVDSGGARDTLADTTATVSASLERLTADLAAGLAECAATVLVTAHHAFGYLAADHGLRHVAVAGISPSEEPSASTLRDIATFAAAQGVTTIFFEENLPADLARTVADEIGATTAVLDPIESPSASQLAAGATYDSLMRANLATLREGLACR